MLKSSLELNQSCSTATGTFYPQPRAVGRVTVACLAAAAAAVLFLDLTQVENAWELNHEFKSLDLDHPQNLHID